MNRPRPTAPVGAASAPASALPTLPLDEWVETKQTLHLYLQVIGKIRLALMPRQNHWWHVPLYVSARGLTTGLMPAGSGAIEITVDVLEPAVVVQAVDGDRKTVALHDGLTVADFYGQVHAALAELGVSVNTNPEPFDHPTSTIPFPEDTAHHSYDAAAVHRFWRVLVWVDSVFEIFRGRFTGKATPVHLFWHSFDLAYTRFSGRRAPDLPNADPVTQDAYSHEVISFGFWAGDDTVPAPAFYSYTYPQPEGITEEALEPSSAFWNGEDEGAMALMMYDDVRTATDPKKALLTFLESAYAIGARRAGWDTEALATPWAP